ncbi:Atrazine chlorohydrolase [Phocoenobacter uteri]|uniref:Atrazine chlorohydrolase n=1 Tax=Phocoenobacter uteri TaxID=146806 RepID=A0A379CE03_9PAST|nr:amidohydrolase [Phocoenobacter uteri]MDG6881897.1 amidohydrolase [Phocoenobacter uteri]SUB59935.1 Atrazine chlorohydrolase [Phocoenobacter uteri]
MKKLLALSSVLALSLFNYTNASENVDLIVKNGMILTMNQAKEIIDDGVVIVNKNQIIDVGDKNLLQKYSAKKVIDAEEGIVMPGMINTHSHISMSVFRSLADDVPNRLQRYIFPLENKMVSKEMVYTGAVHGAIELAKGGVTTVVDMYLFEDSAAKAVKEVGLRGVMTQNIIKYPTADGKDGAENIEMAIAFVEKYKNDELITAGFGPHAPHTVKKADLERIRDLSQKYNAPVSMHVAETQKEFDKFKAEYNMTPIEYLDSVGLLNERFIAAHCIFVTESDIALMKKRNIGVAHNMVANIKSAKGVSPALKMFDEGLNIGLGSDGPMSGNTLDIIGQIGYVAKLHKLMNKDRSVMPPQKVVEMATMGGARAIHREKDLGSLEKGKLADIVILETKSTNMQPNFDPYSVLVYSANASNVSTTIVNGKIIMEKRKLRYNEEKSNKAIKEFSKKVKEIAKTL